MKMKNKKQEEANKRKALKKERRAKKAARRRKEIPSIQSREEEKTKTELPSILIVCEGKNTEPSYFNQFEVTSAKVKALGEGYNTISLVTQAHQLQQKAAKDNTPYDQVWCVFDKDDFENEQFEGAIELAKKYKFGVAYSNQAFEYWLFLHFNDHQGGSMNREDCCKELSKLLAPFGCQYDHKKSKRISDLLFDLLLANDPKDVKNRSRQALAILRAKKILQFHQEQDNSPAQAESSTTVFHLVEELNKYL